MLIGVPKEVKADDHRLVLTLAGVPELISQDHEVLVERDAGVSSYVDDDHLAAGAKIVDSADDVWAASDIVVKVKKPIAEEYSRLAARVHNEASAHPPIWRQPRRRRAARSDRVRGAAPDRCDRDRRP
jgi:alanine dehydrogenase